MAVKRSDVASLLNLGENEIDCAAGNDKKIMRLLRKITFWSDISIKYTL